MYGLFVKNPASHEIICFHQCASQAEVKDLEKRLVQGDPKSSVYFSHTCQALKIKNIFLRILSTLKAVVWDLLTLPCASSRHQKLRARLKEEGKIPLYEFLKQKGVSTKNLEQNRFILIFCNRVEKREWGEKLITGATSLGIADSNLVNPDFLANPIYVGHDHYIFNICSGAQATGSGHTSLPEVEYIARNRFEYGALPV